LCNILCKNIWVAAPPYSEGLAFLGTPYPLPRCLYLGCVVILNIDSNGVFDILDPPDASSRRETVQDFDVAYRRFGVVALGTAIAERRWELAGYLHGAVRHEPMLARCDGPSSARLRAQGGF
jgi:hypothetical protein